MDEFDVIVVGAGSAGCVVAARLSEDPGTRVLLLEAGPQTRKKEMRIPAAFPQLFETEVDWNYRTEPQAGLDGRRIYTPRGKMLGGSSGMNAMMQIPGHRQDQEDWVAEGAEGWGPAELAPYRRRAHDALAPRARMARGCPLRPPAVAAVPFKVQAQTEAPLNTSTGQKRVS